MITSTKRNITRRRMLKIAKLELEKYSNLYIEFFAGFNIYNQHANLSVDA